MSATDWLILWQRAVATARARRDSFEWARSEEARAAYLEAVNVLRELSRVPVSNLLPNELPGDDR